MMKTLLCSLMMCVVVLSVVGSASADKWFRNNVDTWYETPENWQDGVVSPSSEKINFNQDDDICVIRAGVEGTVKNMYQTASNSIVILGGVLNCTAGWDNVGRNSTTDLENLSLRVIGDGVYYAPTCNLKIPNDGLPNRNGRLNVYGGVTTLSALTMQDPLVLTEGKGHCDIRSGLLLLSGDDTAAIEGYIDGGMLTAYNRYDGAFIDYSYDSASNQTTVKAISGANPYPANMAAGVASGVIQLIWDTPAEPNADTTCNVYFGSQDDVAWQNFGDPNFQQVFENLEFRKTWIPDPNVPLHEANVTDNAVEVTAEYGNVYYWKIEYVNPSGSIAAKYNFTFDTKNVAPQAEAGENIITWLTDGSVTETLAGVMVEDDEVPVAATATWSVITAKDLDNVDIDMSAWSGTGLDAQITLTVSGWYELQLDVSDTSLSGSPDTMNIYVRDNSCEAAKITDGFVRIPGDVDENCNVDLADFALLSETWLETNYLE